MHTAAGSWLCGENQLQQLDGVLIEELLGNEARLPGERALAYPVSEPSLTTSLATLSNRKWRSRDQGPGVGHLHTGQ